MIQVEERGRRLLITVGGELVYDVPPQNSRGGTTLLAGFVGIMADVFGGEASPVATDLVRLSLGQPIYADAQNPTEAEQARADEAEVLYQRIQEELRPAEAYEVTQAAFFWQTAGGIEASRAFLEGGPDAYPKALDILAERSGLEILSRPTLTGNSSESVSGPTASPATSSPAPSESSSKETSSPTTAMQETSSPEV